MSLGLLTANFSSVDARRRSKETPLKDWIARSTAPNVFWANRFNNADADYWIRTGTEGTGASAARCSRIASDGIIGDGCLQIYTPAGNTPGTAYWQRPLAPVIGAGVSATTGIAFPTDINNAGATLINFVNNYTSSNISAGRINNYRGGCFGKADYYDPTTYLHPDGWGVPEYSYAGTFWIQFRIKISASRLAASSPGGKLFMLEWCAGGTCMHEIVINTPGYQGSWPGFESLFGFYTAQGSRSVSKLYNPQNIVISNPGAQVFPNGEYPLCVLDNNSAVPSNAASKCYGFPADKWVTVMVGVTPGSQSTSSDGGYSFTNRITDAGLVIKVAEQGATRWTTLCNKSDFYWYYDGSVQSFWNNLPVDNPSRLTVMPKGWNTIRLTQFNGGSNQLAVANDEYVWFDQIIVANSEIALPKF